MSKYVGDLIYKNCLLRYLFFKPFMEVCNHVLENAISITPKAINQMITDVLYKVYVVNWPPSA